jgi:hypothetical protein
MRNMLLIGSMGLFAAIGAASGALADNPTVPSWSPYAIMGYDVTPPAAYSRMETHRAAAVDHGYANDTKIPNANVPSWTPYAIIPAGL